MVNRAIKAQEDPGPEIPSYTRELGVRISSIISDLGGLKNAASFIKETEEQLARWRDGKSKPAFFALVALSRAADVSLDWIATGKGPRKLSEKTQVSADIDLKTLQNAIHSAHQQEQIKGETMSIPRKSELILDLYRILLVGENKEETDEEESDDIEIEGVTIAFGGEDD